MSLPPAETPPRGEPELPEDWCLDWEEPTDADLLGLCPDPFAGPPDGENEWLGEVSLADLDALAAEGRRPPREGIGAGFTRDLPGPAATGFAAGGPLDGLAPGPTLAGYAAETFDAGFAGLDDDELIGMLCAARRLQAWQAAMEFTAIAELDARRRAAAEHPESSRVHDHVNAELAAALTMTGRSADGLLDLARALARLPAVVKALAQGQIDRDRAEVFAAELAVLDAKAAAAVAMGFAGIAGTMTTGQLRAALRAMVLTLKPDAARERAERGRRQARVEIWPENSGNFGLAGRELPPADAIEADSRITAIARALHDAGAPGDLGQLKLAVFTALLVGRDPASLAPAWSDSPATMRGSVHLTMPVSAWLGRTDHPGDVAGFGPVDSDTCRDLAERLAATPGNSWCLTLTGPDGRAVAHGCASTGPATTGPATTGPAATGPATSGPASSDRTVTDPPGDPPATGPPAPITAGQAWLASINLQWLERDRCGHPWRTSSYRPGRTLRHLIIIRHRTCGFPGCTRPAVRCDVDHTIPYEQGGITCECNTAPLCRQHHKTKQALGWHLTQPHPGQLVWTTPHGRTYTVTPDRYP